MPILNIPYLLTCALLFLAIFCIAFLSLCIFLNYFRCFIFMWHWFLALRLKSGTEQTMKLLHQHHHLKASVMYLALRLSNLCSTTVQDPAEYIPQLGKGEEEKGWQYQSLLIYLVSCGPGCACWALKCKAVKAFPCKWIIKSNPPLLFSMFYTEGSPCKGSVLPSGSAAVNGSCCFVQMWVSPAGVLRPALEPPK